MTLSSTHAVLVAALVVGAAACNRNSDANNDANNDVGRGPGDEAAQRTDMDPTLAPPGGMIDQNNQGAPGASPADQDRDARTDQLQPSPNPGSADTLGNTTGGTSNPGGSTNPKGGRTGTGGASGRSSPSGVSPDGR